MKGTLMPR